MGSGHSHGAGLAPGGRADLTRFAWLSIGTALVTMAAKLVAFQLTGSVGLLSDAAESIVNLVAAFVALIALHVAARPADDNHPYGHTKAEYFAAALEGLMICVAAVAIIWTAVARFVRPQPLENVGVGLTVSVGAAVLNGVVALVLLRAGRAHRSITLEADGKHLLTDVWTSASVLVGVVLVPLTGWLRLDPLVAFVVGCNIVWTGWHLVRRSLDGLLDRSLPAPDMATLNAVLDRHRGPHVEFHALRTREAGHQRFVSVHVQVPGEWTVQQGHDLAHVVEDEIRAELHACEVDTHIEPREGAHLHAPSAARGQVVQTAADPE
jgi:cation diffusion facilitator family transporter